MPCKEALLLRPTKTTGSSIIINQSDVYNGPAIVANLCNPINRNKCCLGEIGKKYKN